jgi:uncharacterized protein YuzE
MASHDNTLDLDYDEQNDVLYASLGSPKAALSYEVSKDIWLDYTPPHRTVVGITILNFLKRYPVPNRDTVFQMARTVVQDMLQRYPSVPIDQALVTIHINPVPWLQSVSTATLGIHTTPLTHVVGFTSHVESLRIQGNRIVPEDAVA